MAQPADAFVRHGPTPVIVLPSGEMEAEVRGAQLGGYAYARALAPAVPRSTEPTRLGAYGETALSIAADSLR